MFIQKLSSNSMTTWKVGVITVCHRIGQAVKWFEQDNSASKWQSRNCTWVSLAPNSALFPVQDEVNLAFCKYLLFSFSMPDNGWGQVVLCSLRDAILKQGEDSWTETSWGRSGVAVAEDRSPAPKHNYILHITFSYWQIVSNKFPACPGPNW